MRTLERRRGHESLTTAIERIAYAYGFSMPPVQIPKKVVVQTKSDAHTGTSIALLKQAMSKIQPAHSWGYVAMPKRKTMLSFGIIATKQPMMHALIVKATHAIAELAGLKDLHILVSSVGDTESKRRFTRELGTFFRKHASVLSDTARDTANRDPERAYRELIEEKNPLLERAPKTIDYLSESSRKIMLDTLSLFESVNIPYVLEPRLTAAPNVHAELVFAIEGADREGQKTRVAYGGRFDDYMKRESKSGVAVSMSVEIPDSVDLEPPQEIPSCYVVHVGDIAKLRAFSALEMLWRANVLAGEMLLSETLREQIDAAKTSKTKYVAIIGQREALDGTVIVRNTATQLQTVMPLERLPSHVGRR